MVGKSSAKQFMPAKTDTYKKIMELSCLKQVSDTTVINSLDYFSFI